MRTLEIIIPCILIIYLLWPLVMGQSRPKAINGLPIIALLFMILHLIIEKYRWQMVPLYVLAGICCLAGILGLTRTRKEKVKFNRLTWATTGIVASALVLVTATALPVLLPVPRVPPPSGPHQIGTTTKVLVDTSRTELYSANPGEPRRFMVQVWYPANPSPDSPRAPWMADAEIVAPSLADFLHLPHFFLDHLTLVQTNSYIDAPADLSGGPYPVLFFSHGWNGFRAQNTNQVQELVSHGYVVISLEYTYADRIAVFPDGQVALHNSAILPVGVSDEEYAAAARTLLEQWTGDLVYTLNTFTALNESDPAGMYTGLLDMDKVGAFGHSTGGGASIQFCATEPRCKAAFAMDAWMTPVSEQVLDTGTDRPLLFLFSEAFPTETNWMLFDRLASHLTGPVSVATILGTAHYDFSDLPALSPLAPQMGLKGPLNGQRVITIVNDFSLAFFDWALKDKPTALLHGPLSVYPELEFRVLP
jgi:predicted dienelactone hydrolase